MLGATNTCNQSNWEYESKDIKVYDTDLNAESGTQAGLQVEPPWILHVPCRVSLNPFPHPQESLRTTRCGQARTMKTADCSDGSDALKTAVVSVVSSWSDRFSMSFYPGESK